ncbi:hypothetical protein J3E68DRAFT_394972 [Trichoderma sp. SZMC 28012]
MERGRCPRAVGLLWFLALSFARPREKGQAVSGLRTLGPSKRMAFSVTYYCILLSFFIPSISTLMSECGFGSPPRVDTVRSS